MPSEWQRYRLSWRLASPLHIGYRTIGTIARTRLWVPGRNVWGALIDALARAQGATSQSPGKFGEVQKAVNAAMRFEAWFIGPVADHAWYPKYELRKEGEVGENGLHYGDIPEREMQRLVLGANVSTAIDHGPTIAEEGMLFETEYISPCLLRKDITQHDIARWQKGEPVYLAGHLWAKATDEIRLNPDDIIVQGISLKSIAGSLSIGGERAKGYGQLVEGTLGCAPDSAYIFDGEHLIVREMKPFPLWVETEGVTAIRGEVEPVVGRSTTDKGYGASLTKGRFCWLPGSVCEQDITVQFDPEFPGIARIVQDS